MLLIVLELGTAKLCLLLGSKRENIRHWLCQLISVLEEQPMFVKVFFHKMVHVFLIFLFDSPSLVKNKWMQRSEILNEISNKPWLLLTETFFSLLGIMLCIFSFSKGEVEGYNNSFFARYCAFIMIVTSTYILFLDTSKEKL